MKKILCLQFVLFFALTCFASSQSVDEIIAANLKARGITQQTSCYLEGEQSAMGQSLPCKYWVNQDNKLRLEQSVQGQNIVIIRDKEHCWLSYQGNLQELPQEQAGEIDKSNTLFQLIANCPFVNYKKLGLKVSAQGTDLINGKTCNIIQIDYPTDMQINVYIDKETNLEVKYEQIIPSLANADTEEMDEQEEMATAAMQPVLTLSNWKTFDGIQVPTAAEAQIGDMIAINYSITKAQFNQKFDEKLFSKPE